MEKLILAIVVAFIIGVSINASASIISISNTKIERVLISSKDYGHCMILIDKSLSGYGLDCPSRWVSLSCDGTFNPKDIAFRKLDQAQMAFALNRTIKVNVDDTKKHNGYCFGERVDIF